MNASLDPMDESGTIQSYQADNCSGHTTRINSSDGNEQPVTVANFASWYLEQLRSQLSNAPAYIFHDLISVNHRRFIQDYQQNPQILLSQEGLELFSCIIRDDESLLQSHAQYATSKATDERIDRHTSAPTDVNEDYTDEQLRALTQYGTALSSTLKRDVPSGYLSHLLLDHWENIPGDRSIQLEIVHPPESKWHARTINCLQKNQCSPLQSAIGRQYIVLKWSNSNNLSEENLFVHVGLLGFDNKTHLSKCIVPPETKVIDLYQHRVEINDKYGFNLLNGTILFPLEKVKSADKAHEIVLPVVMFNLSKTDKTRRGPAPERKEEETTFNFVESENRKICKLRLKMCQLTNDGRIKSVSEHIDTNFIRECKQFDELGPIDPNQITPRKPCECGKEDLSVVLNANSEKAGFVVIIDGHQLAMHEFSGVTNNTITIHPPRKEANVNNFHLIIRKINVLKTIEQGRNPWHLQELIEDVLLDTNIEYTDCNRSCSHLLPIKRRRKQ